MGRGGALDVLIGWGSEEAGGEGGEGDARGSSGFAFFQMRGITLE